MSAQVAWLSGHRLSRYNVEVPASSMRTRQKPRAEAN